MSCHDAHYKHQLARIGALQPLEPDVLKLLEPLLGGIDEQGAWAVILPQRECYGRAASEYWMLEHLVCCVCSLALCSRLVRCIRFGEKYAAPAKLRQTSARYW